MAKRTCSIEGCERPVCARGWCPMHYDRWRKWGDPLVVGERSYPRLPERFWSKVSKDGPVPEHVPELGPCWPWTGRRHKTGYGQLKVGRAVEHAHRYSWVLHFGEIPDETPCVLHNCDNRACVNAPGGHLRLGTHQDNMDDKKQRKRSANSLKTECIRGHPLSGENLYVTPDGRRQCSTCRRAASKRARSKRQR